MGNLIDNAIAAAHASLASVAGRVITYRRGSTTVSIEDALIGESRFEVVEASGFHSETVSRDYLIPAAELAGLAPAEPREGDQIEEQVGGERRVYEVMRPGPGQTAWRYRDAARAQLRIHTKHVQTVEVE
ncbi:hypothetical protein ACERK3_09420 [Phycisphaerales bacterium AB-hyl4]|uniref:Phage head-tail joining protein domain-containing protein n=1 Tax=Natronomicrosphaera hydrolytica TaxID=3242702 RepID=A0ABV4U6Q8_9BACT